MSWTDDRVALLKNLWREGLPVSQIATEIGGVTRNSCIGKARRLGLPTHESKQRMVTRSVPRQPPKRRSRARPTVAAGPPIGLDGMQVVPRAKNAPTGPRRKNAGLSILDLRFAGDEPADCRWPLGDWMDGQDLRNDPPASLFCGESAIMGKAYCGTHCRRAFRPLGR